MSRLNSPSFHIGHSSGRCAATGRLLAVGEHFVVALVEPEGSDDLVRIDYSLEAWSRGSRPPTPARLFGYWKGVVLPPSAKPHALIDDEGLLDLFDQLGEQTDPRRVAFRFVLGLILIRKRLLVLEDSRPPASAGESGGGTAGSMLVRIKGTPRPPEGPPLIEVTDPGLDDDALDGVVEQLEAVMPGVTPTVRGPEGTP